MTAPGRRTPRCGSADSGSPVTPARVTLVDVLRAGRSAGAGALLTAAVLLAGPAAAGAAQLPVADRATAPALSRTAEVVGGPELAAPGIVVHYGAGATPVPKVDADSWLVADLTTGQVLAAKGAHHKAMPASMLKTLTAVTLMPRLDKNAVVTATDAEARAVGGHVGIVPGATYTVWDLWHGLLLPSANDAATALADANGGMTATVRQMQAMAVRLRADDTTVKNNSGLDNPAQLSSAYDMALFARAAMTIPDFQTVTQSINYDFPGRPVAAGAVRRTYKIYSQNRLLLHGYSGTIGGKTGFTSLAHRTFWGAARRGGHTLVVTLFQIHDPTEKAARALLDWGFANRSRVTPVGTLVAPISDAATPAATVSPAAAAGSTTAAASAAAGTGLQVPWKVVGAVVVALAALALLWWRRRATRDDPPSAFAPSTAPIPPLVDTSAAPDRATGRTLRGAASHPTSSTTPTTPSARPAAVRTSSVVVTSPRGSAGADVAPTVTDAPGDPVAPATGVSAVPGLPAGIVVAAVDPQAAAPQSPSTEGTFEDTAPIARVVDTSDGAAATDDEPPAGPPTDAPAPEPEPAPAPPTERSTPPMPRPSAGSGSNVRLITPPPRPPSR